MSLEVVKHTAKDFSALRGLEGITDEQVEIHLELYEGYVKRSSGIDEKLLSLLEDDETDSAEYHELKRRAGWERNGVILHELYFENLSPGGDRGSGRFEEIAARRFGSFETWKKDMLGVAAMPGVGWAVTLLDPASGTIDNWWIDRHDIGHPVGHRAILVLDVWEHAFSGYLRPTQREQYLEDFFANVDWRAVESRLAGRKS